MSFLSDTQEFTAVVLPEFDIEMLALKICSSFASMMLSILP